MDIYPFVPQIEFDAFLNCSNILYLTPGQTITCEQVVAGMFGFAPIFRKINPIFPQVKC